jgi:hypothetical protein
MLRKLEATNLDWQIKEVDDSSQRNTPFKSSRQIPRKPLHKSQKSVMQQPSKGLDNNYAT